MQVPAETPDVEPLLNCGVEVSVVLTPCGIKLKRLSACCRGDLEWC